MHSEIVARIKMASSTNDKNSNFKQLSSPLFNYMFQINRNAVLCTEGKSTKDQQVATPLKLLQKHNLLLAGKLLRV